MKQVVAQRQDIAFFIKLYPLPSHPQAYDKSVTIMCAKSNDERLKLLEDFFAKKPIQIALCPGGSVVDKMMETARLVNLQGTPGIFFEDGTRIAGAAPAAEIIKKVDSIKK